MNGVKFEWEDDLIKSNGGRSMELQGNNSSNIKTDPGDVHTRAGNRNK